MAPHWTGRPQGPPAGVVVSGLPLARSEQAAVYVDYLDAYPEGFELAIRASSSSGFGRSDLSRTQLLRIGVRFADGRAASGIVGQWPPAGDLAMRALAGGVYGGGGEWRLHQGYWVSPLPPPGPVGLECEWRALDMPTTRREVDAQLILDAAERARAMFGDGRHVSRDGRTFHLGTDAEVSWINEGTAAGNAITAAIPPIFASYCTLDLNDMGDRVESARHEQAVIKLLSEQTPGQPWWLGYLDTGASDVVFPYTPRTTLYSGYSYVLVQAGPQQAASWRDQDRSWTLPELIFPMDRSWLLSTMWDDDYSSIGGSRQLVDGFLSDTTLGSRVTLVTPG